MSFRLYTATLLFLARFSCFAQEPVYLSYDWENPVIHSISSELNNFPAVYVLHNRFLELQIEQQARCYFTEHKIIHLNTAAGIERFNKVYIPLPSNQKLVALKVRSIDPKGKVTLLKKESLKELHNVEGYGDFKIFAVEGLTLGGEMEYIYTTESNPPSFGRYKLQSEIPVMEASVVLLSPSKFEFKAKSYNGLPKPKMGKFNNARNMTDVTAVNIPALTEEQYSAVNTHQMRIDFKLETNVNMLDWESISNRFLKSSYDPSASGKVKKLLKSLSLDELTELQKIQLIEKYIKINFTLKEGGGDEYEDLKNIIEKRIGNDRGILKLYMSCFEELNIAPQLVMCANRFKGKIDIAFATAADISDILFYFPNQNQYLSPTIPYLRLGAAPDYIASSRALFIQYDITDHNINFIRYDIRSVEPLSYLHNNLGVKATVNFSEKLELPSISQETFWQGYRASNYRGYYYYRSNIEKEKFLKEVTLSGIDNVNVIKQEIEGEDVNLSIDPDSYFKVKTKYTAASLVEKAGEDYLLAVGKLIGQQSELYQEKQRQMDIEFTSIANYNHEITINIPKDYTCTGLDGIKIKNEVIKGNEEVMKFHSDFELNGDNLVIRINEVYKVLQLSKNDYDAFRRVVNSAADFNKVVLVLHPKAKHLTTE